MAHQIDESKPKYLSQTRFMSGRRIIKTSVTEITDENVVDVLRKALATHELNRSEIDYLWKYYRGDQPIRNRVKDVRPEICNKITENRANEIVSFKVGYLCGEPIQYVSRNGGEEIVKQINTLNEYMFAEDKAAQDQELVEWQMICGTAFRLVLPDEPGEEDEAPFELYTLDPRDTFVVYSNEIGNKPLMAVKYSKDDNEIFHYSIYTENRYYLVDGDILVESKPHALDMIPIIEYPGNNARLGSFEIVLPLLDAMHSSIVSGMAQFSGYWQSMSRDIVTCANGIINAVVVSTAGINDNLVLASASGYDPYNSLAQTVYEDSKKSYDGAYSDDSWSRNMREFYHEYVEPTLKEIATDSRPFLWL